MRAALPAAAAVAVARTFRGSRRALGNLVALVRALAKAYATRH